MNLKSKTENASVLLTAFLTMTVLILICATSLYITAQNSNAGMQTASWQQALSAAESAVDCAIRALNVDATQKAANASESAAWTGLYSPYSTASPSPTPVATTWGSGTGSIPSTSASPPLGYPVPATIATGPPTTGNYNYLNPAVNLNFNTNSSEGNTYVTSWVTIDTATSLGGGSNQWYRVRATGQANSPSLFRASPNKLDDVLRNSFALRYRRNGNVIAANSYGTVTRSVEVILYPITSSGGWARAITMQSGVQMSGGGLIDSFNSNSYSSNSYQYATSERDNPGQAQVGLVSNTTNSDLRNTYVYGSLAYSGTAVKNTTNVKGSVATPFSATITTTIDPSSSSWATTDNLQQYTTAQQSSIGAFTITGGVTNYTQYNGGGSLPTLNGNTATSFSASGTQASPALIKVNGDFTVSGSNVFNINSSAGGGYIVIWVSGKFTTSGSGQVVQDANAKVTWIVDNDITVSGTSYMNAGGSGRAANLEFIGVGNNHNVTVSGSANFIGTMNAPSDSVTISGGGDFVGAIIGNNLTISGGSSFHYDDALSGTGSNSSIGNYAFANWFENDALPGRNYLATDSSLHSIVY